MEGDAKVAICNMPFHLQSQCPRLGQGVWGGGGGANYASVEPGLILEIGLCSS